MKKTILVSLSLLLVWPLSLAATTVITTVCDDFGICKTTYSTTARPAAREFGVGDRQLYEKLRGRIILAVERNGEAYYVSPSQPVIYYLGNMETALRVMLEHGQGISNANLNRLKVGVLGMYGNDADSDGLSDRFEEAIGTNQHNFNTDNDVYSDFVEITSGYSPVGAARLPIDWKYAGSLKGRVLLQTQLNGEAWYLNPADSKRYYLASKYDANDLIKHLALGISNANFNRLVR